MNRIIEAMDFESNEKNWKYSFKKMTKKYGKDFIDLLKIMWSMNDNIQSVTEFCEMNGVPENFFNKVIIKKCYKNISK